MVQLVIFASSAAPAAESTGLNIDVVALLQNSALVAVIVFLLFGLLWAKPSVDRILADKEKAEKQRDDLLQVYEDKMLPAMADATTAIRDITPVMSDAVSLIREIRREMER